MWFGFPEGASECRASSAMDFKLIRRSTFSSSLVHGLTRRQETNHQYDRNVQTFLCRYSSDAAFLNNQHQLSFSIYTTLCTALADFMNASFRIETSCMAQAPSVTSFGHLSLFHHTARGGSSAARCRNGYLAAATREIRCQSRDLKTYVRHEIIEPRSELPKMTTTNLICTIFGESSATGGVLERKTRREFEICAHQRQQQPS
jgi:hypothetical protein